MGESHEPFDLPGSLPVLPVRDLVVFPHMLAPLSVSRPASEAAVREALGRDRLVMLVAQRDAHAHEPAPEEL
ncbi:MAG: LON peptidase substrate-binding domain-containing protein, partial [Myxococcales bacterium]